MDKLGLGQPLPFWRGFFMDTCIKVQEFMRVLLDDVPVPDQAAKIGRAILAARSSRLIEIAAETAGTGAAAYKRVQRFLRESDPREGLWRPFR